MKKYRFIITGHYEKAVTAYADDPGRAVRKMKKILEETDLLDFSDADYVGGNIDMSEVDEDGTEGADAEMEDLSEDECWGCPYYCHVQKGCTCKEKCDRL